MAQALQQRLRYTTWEPIPPPQPRWEPTSTRSLKGHNLPQRPELRQGKGKQGPGSTDESRGDGTESRHLGQLADDKQPLIRTS